MTTIIQGTNADLEGMPHEQYAHWVADETIIEIFKRKHRTPPEKIIRIENETNKQAFAGPVRNDDE